MPWPSILFLDPDSYPYVEVKAIVTTVSETSCMTEAMTQVWGRHVAGVHSSQVRTNHTNGAHMTRYKVMTVEPVRDEGRARQEDLEAFFSFVDGAGKTGQEPLSPSEYRAAMENRLA